jgi:hypothetical protein
VGKLGFDSSGCMRHITVRIFLIEAEVQYETHRSIRLATQSVLAAAVSALSLAAAAYGCGR